MSADILRKRLRVLIDTLSLFYGGYHHPESENRSVVVEWRYFTKNRSY